LAPLRGRSVSKAATMQSAHFTQSKLRFTSAAMQSTHALIGGDAKHTHSFNALHSLTHSFTTQHSFIHSSLTTHSPLTPVDD
jgi:hypothetical protein